MIKKIPVANRDINHKEVARISKPFHQVDYNGKKVKEFERNLNF